MFTSSRSICVFALTATGLFAQTSPAPLVQETVTTGMIGIAEGQTARLNTLNPGVTPPTLGVVCSALLTYVDGQGTVLKSAVVSVNPGKSVWLDLFSNGDLGLAADQRRQIRATITVPPILPPAGSTTLPAPCSLIGTLEIFDTLSGKTQVVLGGTHLVPNPVAVPTPVTASTN